MRVTAMNTSRFTAALAALLLPCPAAIYGQQYPFQDPNLPLEQRVDNILSLMTLDEKLACLATSTAVPRLHIPDAGGTEGLHGLVRKGDFNQKAAPTTQFPEVIGMASTWDPALMRRVGAVQGYEARYIYQHEKYKDAVLIVWGPNADLARDPRWGRNNESYGEDAFFDGTMSVAFIKGMQGDNAKYWQAASLMKHFLANSNETTRGRSSSDFDEKLLMDYYSVPFRMGFVEGGAKSFMASYNAWNGVPMTVNPILKTLAVKEWGADGIISSDALAVELMMNPRQYYPTQAKALAEAMKAGIGQVLTFFLNIPKIVKQDIADHLLTEADIDAVLKGKFRTVIRLGLLDPPAMVPYASIGAPGEPEPWTTEKHKRVALDVARESVVLLKNANGLLPLDKSAIKSIAVIGPRAGEVLIDLYGGKPAYSIAPLQGIRDKVGSGVVVHYAANNDGDAAVKAARSSDVAVVVAGNHPLCGATKIMEIFNMDVSSKPCADPGEGREGRDRESINLSQEELIKQVYAANPKTVVVLVSSFPYAIADVLFGDYNPAGRLNQTWPKSLDQLPDMMDYNIRHGRTYMYFKGEPLYPFGYGLSYTTFKYSKPRYGSGMVSVDVTNNGKRAGDEVVQLYEHAADRKQLRGFQRVSLKPNETRTVEMPFKPETGSARLVVGGSSADARLETTILRSKY
jgi:beta-glucosidase